MTTTPKSNDDGTGCLVLIAMVLITIGACWLWGLGALLVIGGIIMLILIFS